MTTINTANARQWLNRARKIDREINQDLELIRHTHERLTNVTQALDAITVSGTKDPHKFDSLVEMEDAINAKIAVSGCEILNVSRSQTYGQPFKQKKYP